MKSWWVLPVAGALLLFGAGVSSAVAMQQNEQPSAQTATQENTNASAQSGVDTGYGGVSSTRSASGSARTRPLSTGPQCDIFFGN